MDGFSIGDFSGADERGHIQIALMNRRRSDTYGLIGKPNIFCVCVRKRMGDNGFDAHFFTRPLNTERDFSSVCDKDLTEHRYLSGYSMTKSG